MNYTRQTHDAFAIVANSAVAKAYVLPDPTVDRGLGLFSFIATFDTIASSPAIKIEYKPIIVLQYPSDPRTELTVTTQYIVPFGNDGAAIGYRTAEIVEWDVADESFNAISVADGSYLCKVDFEDVPFDGLLMNVTESSGTGTGNISFTFLYF